MSQPFWNFSIAIYSASAVQDECLNLQDQFGLDVNLVLLCAFLGAVHGVALISDDIVVGPDASPPMARGNRAQPARGAPQPQNN